MGHLALEQKLAIGTMKCFLIHLAGVVQQNRFTLYSNLVLYSFKTQTFCCRKPHSSMHFHILGVRRELSSVQENVRYSVQTRDGGERDVAAGEGTESVGRVRG